MTVRLATGALAAVIVGCGQTTAGGESGSGEDAPLSPSASECSQRASTYLEALRAATACTPGPVSRCTVQRPLVAIAAASGTVVEALCWVASLGMLEPERASTLDPLIDAYTAAGCKIGDCPSPSPHTTECLKNAQGAYTCGGG
jgi:hypothetical protein